MSDAESRAEDARRERWEDRHVDELEQPCPKCGHFSLSMVGKYCSGAWPEPSEEFWGGAHCGDEVVIQC